MDVEQAEAALVEHYPRLVRLAYLTLPSGLGRNRRVLTAHALTQRALPRGRRSAAGSSRRRHRHGGGRSATRVRPCTAAGAAYRAGGGTAAAAQGVAEASQLPPLLPHVWGLRLFPRSGGRRRTGSGPARCPRCRAGSRRLVLRGLEKLSEAGDARGLLEEAGVADPAAALKEAA